MDDGIPAGARIWCACITDVRHLVNQHTCLSDEELFRAQHYRHAADRERFLTARVMLRHALSRVAAGRIPPEHWKFCDGPNGKPKMAPNLPPIEFNLSHAGDCVAIAVSSSGAIGVDVEALYPSDGQEIVYDALTDRECASLQRQPNAQRAFIRYWTLKEACAKALGLGISLDFRNIEIGLDPAHVLNSHALLAAGERLDVASSVVWRGGEPYCLGVAKLVSHDGCNIARG